MLTNDLTEDVLEECVEKKADLIVSYHPPIFRPLKRLTQENWKVGPKLSYVRMHADPFDLVMLMTPIIGATLQKRMERTFHLSVAGIRISSAKIYMNQC